MLSLSFNHDHKYAYMMNVYIELTLIQEHDDQKTTNLKAFQYYLHTCVIWKHESVLRQMW